MRVGCTGFQLSRMRAHSITEKILLGPRRKHLMISSGYQKPTKLRTAGDFCGRASSTRVSLQFSWKYSGAMVEIGSTQAPEKCSWIGPKLSRLCSSSHEASGPSHHLQSQRTSKKIRETFSRTAVRFFCGIGHMSGLLWRTARCGEKAAWESLRWSMRQVAQGQRLQAGGDLQFRNTRKIGTPHGNSWNS